MLVSRVPGRASPPAGLRSYSPSMLFMWIPVPGTITPEPEPVEAVIDAAFPCGVDDGDVRRAALARARARRRARRGRAASGGTDAVR